MSRLETWDRAKDPDEVLDYVYDYADELDDGDTISTSALTVDKGHVTISSSTNTTTAVTVWFAGGQAGEICEITNRIVTTGARTIERTARLIIRRR